MPPQYGCVVRHRCQAWLAASSPTPHTANSPSQCLQRYTVDFFAPSCANACTRLRSAAPCSTWQPQKTFHSRRHRQKRAEGRRCHAGLRQGGPRGRRGDGDGLGASEPDRRDQDAPSAPGQFPRRRPRHRPRPLARGRRARALAAGPRRDGGAGDGVQRRVQGALPADARHALPGRLRPVTPPPRRRRRRHRIWRVRLREGSRPGTPPPGTVSQL